MYHYQTQTIQQYFVAKTDYLLSLLQYMNWYTSKVYNETEYLKLKAEVDRVRNEIIGIEDMTKTERQQKIRFRCLIEESKMNF